MPYASNEDLPPAVKKLPVHKQTIFRKAFNNASKEYEGNESRAFATAWSAAGGKAKDARTRRSSRFSSEYVPELEEIYTEIEGDDAKARYNRHGHFSSSEQKYEEEDDDPDREGKFSGEPGMSEAMLESKPKDSIDFQILGDTQPKATTMQMYDAIELDDEAKVRFLDGGYMSAFPRIARTGIQTYKGGEVGRPEMDTVRVYRPESEVFAKDALHTYTHLPITSEHPSVMVDAKNWHKFAKGETGDEVLRDGGSVRVPMMLRDHDTIQAYKRDEKKQLSVGYNCDLEWTAGETADGEKYDAVQHNVRANHLAIVAAARGGPELSIGDVSKEEFKMNAIVTKNVVIDGIQVEMTDTAAQVVQRSLQVLKDQNEFFKKKKEEAEEGETKSKDSLAKALDTLKAKDAEIVTLRQQLKDAEMSPQKLDVMVKDRQFVIDKARTILGDQLIVDARTVDDIRKQVVDAKLGAQANGWDERQIRSSFDTLTAGVKTDPIRDARDSFSRPHFANVDPRDAAYIEYDRSAATQYLGQTKQ